MSPPRRPVRRAAGLARRRQGKSYPLDAEAAARAVQAHQGAIPEAGDRQVESTVRLAQTTAGLELGPVTTPTAAATLGLRTLARRYQARCLKRSVVREVFAVLPRMNQQELATGTLPQRHWPRRDWSIHDPVPGASC